MPLTCLVAGCTAPRDTNGDKAPLTRCIGLEKVKVLHTAFVNKGSDGQPRQPRPLTAKEYEAWKKLPGCPHGHAFHQGCLGRDPKLAHQKQPFAKAKDPDNPEAGRSLYVVTTPSQHYACPQCLEAAFLDGVDLEYAKPKTGNT
jgi:hypothetical protein